MPERDIFGTVEQLIRMDSDLSKSAITELREGVGLNPYQRIEKIIHESGNFDKGFSTSGGNSQYLVVEGGRQKQKQYVGFSVASLRDTRTGSRLPDIAIYPMGIAGINTGGQAIFHNPDTTNMSSVVLIHPTSGYSEQGIFLDKLTPLFNIDHDGVVLLCSGDQPSVTELDFFNNIVEAFEEAAQR